MARNKNPEITINRILNTSMELFLKKGYDNTTIQDIVDALGDLSKGAIYHHFKSKEEIIEAVIPRLYKGSEEDMVEMDNSIPKNGLEKLRKMLLQSLKNPAQEKLIKAAPTLMKNPKILTQQIYEVVEKIVPSVIEPVIREGMEDGSIKTNNPKEIAETMMILMNVWMNPSVFYTNQEEFRNKFEFLKGLTEGLGLPVFNEEFFEIMEKYRLIIEKSKE
ncbi:TetR/AcrR family transcriptional regulator [uncultured Clostridium sp.]|uniref:TetR/AcrR family transcriptional regulator n=1 Tax=uncultured Clostridium sp. TaxID=59620 RepID=UPI0026300A1A|nr:TetR/AcrR family transcriptional regulator [uncultured Clostridium sp.]